MLKRIKSMHRSTRSNLITYGMVIVFYLAVTALSSAGMLSSAFRGQLVPICAYVILAVSLNLTVGFLGELSLGHAGFMGVGAFTGMCFWVSMQGVIPAWLGILGAFVVGAVSAGISGVIIGIPVLRLEGDYLAIVTLAFGQIIVSVLNTFYLGYDAKGLHVSFKDSASLGLAEDGVLLINGGRGIVGITKVTSFTLAAALVLLTLVFTLNLIRSRAGRAITAIRDNEVAAQSIGLNVTKYKLIAFVSSAVFAGVAGVLYALNYTSLVANKFNYNTSITILVFVVLGGMGSVRGSIIAAALLTVLPEMLRSFSDYRMLAYALVLIIMMIFNQSPQVKAVRERVAARLKPLLGRLRHKPAANDGKGAA